MERKRVVVVAFPGVQLLDFAGPITVFDMATRLLDDPEVGYRVEVVASGAPSVGTCVGVGIETVPLSAAEGPIDTLLVPGGWGISEALEDRTLVSWIAEAAGRSVRTVSVCGGAFLLAEAGLLDGRRATTHWAFCDALAERYPGVAVDLGPIFIRDGQMVTSAGVTTGIDMALSLVQDDHGVALAREVARWLVVFYQRPGGQSQFSPILQAQLAESSPIREVQEWLLNNPEADLSVTRLAERAGMSPRNFARVFGREVGMTPAQYVERARIVLARNMLENTDHPIVEVARRCGYAVSETFFRSFARHVQVTPTEYRDRFRDPTLAGAR